VLPRFCAKGIRSISHVEARDTWQWVCSFGLRS
jgi:hypothetical protein